MRRVLRGTFIVWVVLRHGLDELVLSSFRHPWLRLLSRIVSIGRNLDRPRGERPRDDRPRDDRQRDDRPRDDRPRARHVHLHGAHARTESRGAHAHEDHPVRDDAKWRKHSLAWVDGASVRMDYRPVKTEPLTSEAQGGISLKKIAPAERKF